MGSAPSKLLDREDNAMKCFTVDAVEGRVFLWIGDDEIILLGPGMRTCRFRESLFKFSEIQNIAF
jgi:hypothetical protein